MNLNAIGMAQLLGSRLTPPALLARAADAMARSEPKLDGVNDASTSIAMMQEIGRAKAAMLQSGASGAELRPLVDSLAAGVKYRLPQDTTPTEESVSAGTAGRCAPGGSHDLGCAGPGSVERVGPVLLLPRLSHLTGRPRPAGNGARGLRRRGDVPVDDIAP